MWADVDTVTSESPLKIIYLPSFSIQVPQNGWKQRCSIILSFISQQRHNQRLHLPSQQQQLQQSLSWELIQTHEIPISFLHHPDWKMEVR